MFRGKYANEMNKNNAAADRRAYTFAEFKKILKVIYLNAKKRSIIFNKFELSYGCKTKIFERTMLCYTMIKTMN